MKNNYHCLKEVDVLLPIHYSNEEYLIESINSLLNQTLKPNIICSDSNSFGIIVWLP